MKMMKLAAAATAILAMAASTSAYAGGSVIEDSTGFHPGFLGLPTPDFSHGLGNNVLNGLGELAGAHYEIGGVAANNLGTAQTTSATSFTLKGTVSKDCVFYTGAGTSTTIDFGQIGIQADPAAGPSGVFNMVAPAVGHVTSSVAGCNFNNQVALTKGHGNSGLVNSAAGGYNQQQFQANLPYQAVATWSGEAANSVVATPSLVTLTVGTGDVNNSTTQGAWRSGLNIVFTIPTPTKALVAGDYQDTITLSIAAS